MTVQSEERPQDGPVLEFENIGMRYGHIRALRGVDITVNPHHAYLGNHRIVPKLGQVALDVHRGDVTLEQLTAENGRWPGARRDQPRAARRPTRQGRRPACRRARRHPRPGRIPAVRA
ncbi:MAG: simple sugar transport system ATP-binding protein [Mycobacteriales bacterium]